MPRRGPPSWETPELPRQLAPGRAVAGPGSVDQLANWQSRRSNSSTDAAGSVTGVVYCVGQGIDDAGFTDPMLAYRVDKTRGSVAMDLSRTGLLARLSCSGASVVATARSLAAPSPSSPAIRASVRARAQSDAVLEVWECAANSAVIKLARHESVSLPSAILADQERVARPAVRRVPRGRNRPPAHLRRSGCVRRTLAPGDRDPDPEEVGASPTAWGRAQVLGDTRGAFETFLDELGATNRGAFDGFAGHIRAAARDSLRLATDALGVGAAKLQGAAIAERHLHASLNEILPVRCGSDASPGGPRERDTPVRTATLDLAARKDRAALAELRRSLSNPSAALPYVVPFLPGTRRRREEAALSLVAACSRCTRSAAACRSPRP